MNSRILVGTRKGTFAIERQGDAWVPRLLGHAGVGVNYVAKDPHTGRIWALLGHGHWGAKLSVSDDDGETWADLPNQVAYPAGARFIAQDMFEDSSSDEGVGWNTSVKTATLLKLWVIGFSPGRVWVGTIPGGLFTSGDNGETWALNRPLWDDDSRGGSLWDGPPVGPDAGGRKTQWFGTPASEGVFAAGLHSIDVHPSDPSDVLVAVSTAGVVGTSDGGRTWTPRNKGMRMEHTPDGEAEWGHDTHFIARCPGAPEHVWQQNHVGIYYSSDGAQTWRLVSAKEQGVHFGFPIATDDSDGRTAWVVPGHSDMRRTTLDGRLMVARTEDGGETWQELREGLPQAASYDVVYRHALDQRGGALAFGSTTGNVFVSDDRGDRWQVAANYLPPVYSVRFG